MNWLSKSELNNLYREQKLSINEIAEVHDATYKKVRYWLEKYEIPIRTSDEGIRLSYERKVHGNLSQVREIPELSYLVGVIEGDGNLYDHKGYWIRLCTGSRRFAEKFSGSISKVLHCNPPPIYSKGKYWWVHKRAKLLYTFLNSEGRWDVVDRYPKRFAEGFFDSEGWISEVHDGGLQVAMANTDRDRIEKVSEILDNFDIKHSIYMKRDKRKNRKDCFTIYIWRRDQPEFLSMIGRGSSPLISAGFTPGYL